MWTSASVASYRRPPAGKPPTTAARPADCSSTLPHEAGRWHVSGRSSTRGTTHTGSTRLRVTIQGWILPRQGTEVAHARPVRPALGDCRAAVRSCARALPHLVLRQAQHRGRGASARAQPAAGVLESLRAGVPDAKGPLGSSGKCGPRLHRSPSARSCTRCRSRHVSASVPPAPAGGTIPVSGDMVSWLACRGTPLVRAVLCYCRATASSHLHPRALRADLRLAPVYPVALGGPQTIEWWMGRRNRAPPGAPRG